MLINNFNPRQKKYDEKDKVMDMLTYLESTKDNLQLPPIKININHPGGASKRRLEYASPSIKKIGVHHNS